MPGSSQTKDRHSMAVFLRSLAYSQVFFAVFFSRAIARMTLRTNAFPHLELRDE